jgi:cardiolipin synthase
VPGASDIRALRPLSQAGFRPLLEAGIRVFEWKGPMLHAKTAVADGRWARVGSSNLNVASWIGNYELDAVVENEEFAAEMEDMYVEDLSNATEIVLEPRPRRSMRSPLRRETRDEALRETRGELSSRPGGSASRAAAGALRIGRAVSAALSDQRVLARTDTRMLGVAGVLLLALAALGVVWPLIIVVPLSIVLLWMGIALLIRALSNRRERRSQGLPPTRVGRAPTRASDYSPASHGPP